MEDGEVTVEQVSWWLGADEWNIWYLNIWYDDGSLSVRIIESLSDYILVYHLRDVPGYSYTFRRYTGSLPEPTPQPSSTNLGLRLAL